jgi:septal ring factor EnvC (AmiA/AmiB activator)
MINVDLSVILGLLAIACSFITYVTAANKLRFEVNALKEENKEQAAAISAHKKDITDLREHGSIKTRQIEERVANQERNMDTLRENLTSIRDGVNEMRSEIKSMNERFAIFGYEERRIGTERRQNRR